MRANYFIVLEGLDGCGKTTMAKRLNEWLNSSGAPCIHVREPGGTAFAEQLRNTLLSMFEVGYNLDVTCQAMLLNAARRDLMINVIEPALYIKQTSVVCERFYFSTETYQSNAEQLDLLNKLGSRDTYIDLVLYLRTNYETVVKRIGANPRDSMDVIKEDDFLEKQNLLDRSLGHFEIDNPGAMIVIDANESEDEVFNSICMAVSQLMMLDQLS